jgi:hypothetical protein
MRTKGKLRTKAPLRQPSGSQPAGAERRRSRREPVLTPGVLRPLLHEPAPGTGITLGRAIHVLVTDVSLHGVGFRSTRRLHPEVLYTIEIGVGPLNLTSRLRLARTSERRDGTYEIGGEFC